MQVAAAIIIAVALTHYSYPVLAAMYPDPARAARAIFYILRGFEGAFLFGLLALIFIRNTPASIACLWGCFEEAQTGVCRLSAGIENTVSPPLMSGLCGAQSGWPIWEVSIVAITYMVLQWKRRL